MIQGYKGYDYDTRIQGSNVNNEVGVYGQCVCACYHGNKTRYVLFTSPSEKLLESSLSSSSPLQREVVKSRNS